MTHAGSCLCGGVRFRLDGPMAPVALCHCTQCRRWSGHIWACTSVPLAAFTLSNDRTLVWFRSSATARRGFCATCGASLFWKPDAEDTMYASTGALDGATGLSGTYDLHMDRAGDYYHPPEQPGKPAQPAQPPTLTGSCLCGAVGVTATGPMGAVTACHCTQCRKLSGHFAASFDVAETQAQFTGPIAVYRTPGHGQRGFCPTCGSSLYFRAANGGMSVEAGIVANPTGGHLSSHIFTADKGDYYTLADGLPQVPAG